MHYITCHIWIWSSQTHGDIAIMLQASLTYSQVTFWKVERNLGKTSQTNVMYVQIDTHAYSADMGVQYTSLWCRKKSKFIDLL